MDVSWTGGKKPALKGPNRLGAKNVLLPDEGVIEQVVLDYRSHFPPEPFQQGYLKSFLRAVVQLAWQHSTEGILKQPFPHSVVNLPISGEGDDEINYFNVEEGHSNLQAVGHAHEVYFVKHVARQDHPYVGPEHIVDIPLRMQLGQQGGLSFLEIPRNYPSPDARRKERQCLRCGGEARPKPVAVRQGKIHPVAKAQQLTYRIGDGAVARPG